MRISPNLKRDRRSTRTSPTRKFTAIREKLVEEMTRTETLERAVIDLAARLQELERLWVVARENPELVRELAAQALKGRDLG